MMRLVAFSVGCIILAVAAAAALAGYTVTQMPVSPLTTVSARSSSVTVGGSYALVADQQAEQAASCAAPPEPPA